MFEINLVPNIKADMLRKQRMSNLILFICIIVAAASAGVVLILGSIVGGQNIAMANQDQEITCRSTGIGTCGSNYGTAVLKVENIDDFLTIQDQMSKLKVVNSNKLLLSRVFGILDVILPTGDETVEVSELTVDLSDTSLSFEAQGNSVSNIDYKALEVFKKSATKSYYDFGRYQRLDNETGGYVDIPTMCITEAIQNGVLFGIYHQGMEGCEAPLIPDSATGDEDEDVITENSIEIKDIPIRRVYPTQDDKSKYMEENDDNGGGYFFESKCIAYGSDGKFSEAETLKNCPLLASEPVIRDSSNGRDSNDRLVLRFSASVAIEENVFMFANKHMRVVGPSRQNVTDSYTQIRDMFAEKASDCDPNDTQCLEADNGK
ncbi:MAG: hypothetical protein LBT19_02275 [Candidatus Nomurabacteria bacterium]|jgi:hypothetical protein|nr:hypothetical protein [Candidatus Nomurabacteria bacterium]